MSSKSDIIQIIGNSIQSDDIPMSQKQLEVFERLVSKVIDTDKLEHLATCYVAADNDGESHYFQQEIDKLLNPK